ncbi:hypothetical protein CVT24_001084 [Panaeolus cyanescens]|uniref:MYND-type domain-containing protein n=1 Tax=Panaeolus cyanescens TaxID=181874 RepID=A0A409WBL5_9AGAR|nr:hypothetical protein CVT24_001084 [Panaeolus cyanescens]
MSTDSNDHGIYNFDKRTSKASGTSDAYEACHLCAKKKDDTAAKKLYRCTGCEYAQYCSPECQRADWQNHKSGCKTIHSYEEFGQSFLNFLRHPKLKHFLSVAIILDGNLLSKTQQHLLNTCYTVHLEIVVRHEEKDFAQAVAQGIQIIFSTRRPEDLTAVDTGYFTFHRGINCESDSPSRLGLELWRAAKAEQKKLSPAVSSDGSERKRADNPIVIMNWVWNGTSMGCGVELFPEAFEDAKNKTIRESMRLDGGSGPMDIGFVGERCDLLSDIDKFVAKDESNELRLRMKMSMNDKRILLTLIAEAVPQFLEGRQNA